MKLPQATGVAAQRGGPLAQKAMPRKPTPTRGVAAARSTSTTASDVGPATASLATSDPPKPLKKVAMVSLGCPKNTVDGEISFWFSFDQKAMRGAMPLPVPTLTTPARSNQNLAAEEKLESTVCRTRASPLIFSRSLFRLRYKTLVDILGHRNCALKFFGNERKEGERDRESMASFFFLRFLSLSTSSFSETHLHRRLLLPKKKSHKQARSSSATSPARASSSSRTPARPTPSSSTPARSSRTPRPSRSTRSWPPRRCATPPRK